MKRNLKRVAAFAASRGMTEASLRWQIFNAESNGLASVDALARIGRTVWVDEDGYDRWIDMQNPRRVSA